MGDRLDREPSPAHGPVPAPALSIVVCTYERPALLAALLDSLAATAGVEGSGVEVIVVDNSETGSARDVVEERCDAPFQLTYLTAHPPNISVARNTGVQAARHPFVAFLDDDQRVDTSWLEALRHALARSNHDVLFGPIRPRFENPALVTPFVESMFNRCWDGSTGDDLGAFGRSRRQAFALSTANSVFKRATTFGSERPFDPVFGRCGGEDFKLFCQLQRQGRRFGWLADASAEDFVPAHRCELDYLTRRHLAGAQAYVAALVRTSAHPRLTEAGLLARTLVQAALLIVTRPWRAQPTAEWRRWDRAIRWHAVRGKLTWRQLYALYHHEATMHVRSNAA
jgi:succinoglycan biosynthesis protein ExoM